MKLPQLVRLYTARMAPNPLRVEIALAEKGIEVPMSDLELGAMEPHGPANLDRTGGYPVVPVAELADGTFLTESLAITRYLDALYPAPLLHGNDAKEAAIIDQWCRRLEFGLYTAVAAGFRHTHPKLAEREKQVLEWGQANLAFARNHLDVLDTRLREVEYITGGDYSMADIVAYVTLKFMRVVKLSVREDHVGLQRFVDQISAREAIKMAYSRPPI